MNAADVMSAPVRVISPTDTAAHARRLMVRHHISRLPVIDNGKLDGILTKKDLAYRLRQSEPAWRRRPIDRIPARILMVPDPVVVRGDTGIQEIAALFIEKDISSVPVVEGGEVVGIVSKTDLMRSALFHSLFMPVKDVMEDVVTVSRFHSLDHVIGLMRERNDKIVVVNSDGSLAGIITETNLVFLEYGFSGQGTDIKDKKSVRRDVHDGQRTGRYMTGSAIIAEDVMSEPVVTTGPDVPVTEAVAVMQDRHINSLVVVGKTQIMGIIKRDDIIREVAT